MCDNTCRTIAKNLLVAQIATYNSNFERKPPSDMIKLHCRYLGHVGMCILYKSVEEIGHNPEHKM